MNIKIQQINTEEAYPVRQVILRPGRPAHTCCFDGDHDNNTFHFGAVDKNTLAGICSVYQKAPPKQQGNHYWQIRGMAVLAEYQGQNIGTLLLNYCLDFITQKAQQPIFWCNARIAAANLYKRQGFEIIGEQFEIPDVGPHYLMLKPAT